MEEARREKEVEEPGRRAASGPRFPAGDGRPRPWSTAGRGGVRYAELDPELEGRLVRWVRDGRVAEGEPLKEDVWRAGELVAKFFPPPSGRRRLSPLGPARRAAELARRMRPVPTPRPLLAVEGCGPDGRRGLLVNEYVAGVPLTEAWDHSAAARAALGPFLATMHEHGVHHGDLHPENLLWDGESFFLVDVTALRRGLHLLFAGRLARAQWARLVVYVGDVEGLREAFRNYAALRSWPDPEARWRGVLRHARALVRGRRQPLPRTPDLSREI